ncbi:Ras-GEF domain-containing protein [Meloidogyne graminicola]|uniref:Ras-GEF domain-containing protein n=1 Tax=Meloidogyne graminicola TaxID=189291 RepID=A0A8S9ZJH8_9BILA|nr:Ras-GEF domain-containing protein [Meloidogyne graminicola]
MYCKKFLKHPFSINKLLVSNFIFISFQLILHQFKNYLNSVTISKMSATRESSTETADRYPFGYSTELSSNHESSICTAKRLRQRLQRQQSGQSGRRYTGESSEGSSLVGTPTESGRCFTFTAAQRVLRTDPDRKPSMNQNLSEMLLDAIHMDDASLVDRLLLSHCGNKFIQTTKQHQATLSSSPSITSTNTFTDLAQRRHGVATMQHRRSNASSTLSTHSGGRSNCATMSTLHMAVAHKQRDIVELLLKSGYDPNTIALCHCKGACTTTGNIPLASVLPSKNHSATPEMCAVCTQLRVVSILDQTPLAIAVRAQSPEMINLLVTYGADVNIVDEDGNSPLMLAVRDSPLSWHCLHILILFGARIQQKNSRGICPLDLAPELRKIQETCVESLFQMACARPSASSNTGVNQSNGGGSQVHLSGGGTGSGEKEENGGGAVGGVGGHANTNMSNSIGTISTQERLMKTAAMISATKHLRKSNVDAESLLLPASFCERGSLSKTKIVSMNNKSPLSPRTSAALSVSNSSMLESLSVNKDRISMGGPATLVDNPPIFENVSREQAWETLQKMSSNPECIESIMRSLHKYCAQQLDDYVNPFCGVERDVMDSHLGGLLHQILLTSIISFSLTRQRSRSGTDFQMNAPVQQKWNRQRLVGVLVSLVNFCYLCLQKSGSCRQFAALSTLNKVKLLYVIDAGLVNSVFSWPQITPNKAENEKSDRRETGDSSSAPALILQSFYRKHGVNVGSQHNKVNKLIKNVRLSDLQNAFSSMQPSIIIAHLHNSITMHNREAGNRSVCSPAHRWRQCYNKNILSIKHHCTQILVARVGFLNILLFLTSFKEFRQKISERSQLRTLIQLLEPTLDPVIYFPITLYYTNHSTKFGHFVKYHAARILVYIGLGERVGNRVSLFDDSLLASSVTRRSLTSSQGQAANNSNSANEDDYICETLRPATMAQEFSRTAMSVEGILLKIMQELSRNQAMNGPGNGAQEPISEETPSACASVLASPTVQVRSLVIGQNSANCIIEECEEKADSPLPPLIMPSQTYIDDTPTVTPPNSADASLGINKSSGSSSLSNTNLISSSSSPKSASVSTQEIASNSTASVATNSIVNRPSTPNHGLHLSPSSTTTSSTLTRSTTPSTISNASTPRQINTMQFQSLIQQQQQLTVPGQQQQIHQTQTLQQHQHKPNTTPTGHSQSRPNNVAMQEKQIQQQAVVKRAPSSPPASVTATVARVYNTLVCISNLETHLCKFSLVLDPLLLLRLDLSLVAKKRPTGYGQIGSTSVTPTATPVGILTSAADSRRAHSSCSLGSSFKRGCEEQISKNSMKNSKHFLRVDYASSRLSKRVHIRRSSSVEIPRPKRFSSGAKELRKERNRKRLGTDTSSGSSKSKKTNSSSTSSVKKQLPKYLSNLFRGRMGTDPCKRHHSHASRESSPDSPLSGSEAVLEFTKKLQNIPPTRRDTLRMAYKQAGQQDSAGTAGSAGERIQRHIGYGHLPELEVNSASPPRSPLISTAIVAAAALTSENNSASSSVAVANGNVVDLRRPSSPPVLPGLPLIEIRRPSALSQFEFGYFVNSPEVMSNSQGGSATGSVTDDCAPLLSLSGGPSQVQICSRKSSDESSMCGWSSRASSRLSQRSSSGGLRLSTFSGGTSIASDNSGPFIFSFVLRKRASTIGTRIPLPKRAISRSSGDSSLRVPDRESPLQLLCGIEMSPDFHCVRQLLLDLMSMYSNKDQNFVSTLRSCSDMLREILNTPQHPSIKSWCADILNVINSQLETEEESKFESEERINDDYLDLQDQIISGSLPCPKEEAALLAAVQLCVEENWPNNKRTQTIRRHLLKGQFGRIRDLAQKIMITPWEVDQTLYCTPPRALSDSAASNRKISTNPNVKGGGGILTQQTNEHQQQQHSNRRRRSLTLFSCMSERDPMLSEDVQAQCLPIDLRGDRRTVRLIRERKRKLFHSQIYESEQAMKRLYVQTARKLPAYGCKVYQVKELLHGRTLRKNVRLLCLSNSQFCLLDGCSKFALRRQHAATLQQWRVGGGVSKHQLLLEFRGTKWQLIAPSYNILKSISMTLWEIMQSRTSLFIQKTFNRSARTSFGLFDRPESREGTTTTNRSGGSRTTSYSSTCSSLRNSNGLLRDEPITLFRLELERLQYILHFPEEVAFQLSSTEYQMFYGIAAIDFVRYVGCDLANIDIQNNPSPVKNLVKRFLHGLLT